MILILLIVIPAQLAGQWLIQSSRELAANVFSAGSYGNGSFRALALAGLSGEAQVLNNNKVETNANKMPILITKRQTNKRGLRRKMEER